MLHDRERAESFLLAHPAINAVFDNAFVALPDGVMLARVQKGKPSEQRPNIADREYFQRVVKTGMPVVSRPVIGLRAADAACYSAKRAGRNRVAVDDTTSACEAS